MNYTEPIKDKELLRDIAKYLKNSNERNYILFSLAVYSGLRITDILNLKVKDVKNRNEFVLVEKKTGKRKTLNINHGDSLEIFATKNGFFIRKVK